MNLNIILEALLIAIGVSVLCVFAIWLLVKIIYNLEKISDILAILVCVFGLALAFFLDLLYALSKNDWTW